MLQLPNDSPVWSSTSHQCWLPLQVNGGQHEPFDAGQYSFFGDLGNEGGGGGLEGGLEDALEVRRCHPCTYCLNSRCTILTCAALKYAHRTGQDGVEVPPEEVLQGALEEQDLGLLDGQEEIEDLSYATMFANALTLEGTKAAAEQQRKAELEPMSMNDPIIHRPPGSQVRPASCHSSCDDGSCCCDLMPWSLSLRTESCWKPREQPGSTASHASAACPHAGVARSRRAGSRAASGAAAVQHIQLPKRPCAPGHGVHLRPLAGPARHDTHAGAHCALQAPQ